MSLYMYPLSISISVALPAPIPTTLPLIGKMNYLGSFIPGNYVSNEGLFVDQGNLKGTAALFDLDTKTVTHIYQRYRLLDADDIEINDVNILAIDGNYAICGTYLGGVVIPYNADEDLLLSSDWETQCTLKAGVNFVFFGNDYGLMMLAKGKFLFTPYVESSSVFSFSISTYINSLNLNIQNFTWDLATNGYSGYVVLSCQRKAFSLADNEFAFLIKAINPEDYWDQKDIVLVYSYPDFSLIRVADQTSLPNKEILRDMTQPVSEMCFVYAGGGDDYFYNCSGEFNKLRYIGSVSSYNSYFAYAEYTSRTIVNDDAVYTGFPQDAAIPDATSLVYDKLLSLGYTNVGENGSGCGVGALFLS